MRNLSTWLSHDDAVRMFEAALTTPDPGFAVLYGISANTRAWWDLDAGRALGYQPQDDAERYVDQVTPDDGARRRSRGRTSAAPTSSSSCTARRWTAPTRPD